MGAATAKDARLSGSQIRQQLQGKTISDGTHWAYTLQLDGSVSAIDMGKARSGRWWIDNGQLCLQVPRRAPEDCWTARQGKEGLLFLRDGAAPLAVSVENQEK